MHSTLSNFIRLNEILGARPSIFSPEGTEIIDFNTTEPFIMDYQERIENALSCYEMEYRSGYLEPLKKNLHLIIGDLKEPRVEGGVVKGTDPVRYTFLTLLVNAGIQRSVVPLKRPLGILQDILSDQFNSYLLKRERLGITGSLTHCHPPLIGLMGQLPERVSILPPLPVTLEIAFLREYLQNGVANKFKAGAIGMPAGHKDFPVLWGLIGHEGGGHYTLTADDRLIAELQAKSYEKMLATFPGSMGKALAALWRYWTEEAASDVCGILHLGPTAGIGALSWYTALFPLAWGQFSHKNLTARYDPTNWHPVSIVLPDLLCGAITQLSDLSRSRRSRYVGQIREISQISSDKETEIHFGEKAYVPDPTDPGNRAKFTELPEKLPMQVMRESARTIGKELAVAKLSSLKGHSLQDLTSWTDENEDAALKIAGHMTNIKDLLDIQLSGKPATAMQLISGGVLAVVREPDRFDAINKLLLDVFSEWKQEIKVTA